MSETLIDNNDLGSGYMANRQVATAEDIISRNRARIAQSQKAAAPEEKPVLTEIKPDAQPETASPFSMVKSGIGTVVRNVSEIPTQALGGVSDAVSNTFKALDSFAWWLEEKMPLGKFEGVNPLLELAGSDDRVRKPETMTGTITRDAARFLTGFIPLMRGARAVGMAAGASEAAATVAGSTVAGGITDFFTRSPVEENLANLVQKHPALQNPVTEFMMAKPDDNEALARLKKGIEGAGLGLLTDGMVSAIGAMKSARSAGGTVDQAAEEFAAQRAKYGTANERDFIILGDPTAPALTVSKKPQPEALAEAQRTGKMKKAQAATENVADQMAAKGLVNAGVEGGEDIYINFARINTPDDIKNVMGKMADTFAGNIDEARRGIQSNEETEKLAGELGMTVGDLLARRKGQPFNAEQAVAARRLWAASAEKLLETAEKAASLNAGPVDQFNFRKMMATHYAIQAEVVAARTETARALQSWAIPAGSGVEQARVIQTMLDGMGGPDISREMAKRLAMLKQQGVDAATMNTAIRKGAFATTMDAVKEIWVNGLLSSPTTHIVNTASNSFVALQQIFERGAAEQLGGAIAPGEAAAMTYGLVSGLKDAFRLSWKALKEGQGQSALTKMDMPPDPAFAAKAFGLDESGTVGRVVDFLGTTARVPGRLLGAEDEFFKTIGYRMEVFAQAWRQAYSEGLTGREAGERVARLVADPPEHIRINAADAALYSTFTNQPGEFASTLLKLRNNSNVVPFVLPFVRTPANILNYSFERTPLAPLVGRFRDDIAAGGARSDLAKARMATGSAIMAIAYDMAQDGTLTGNGPDDPGEREALARQGWQQYSIKIGDKNYSYQRTDPLGMTLGLAADMAELIKRGDIEPEEVDEVTEIMAATIASVANTAINKTYMQGVSELVEMLADPERYSASYINNFVASFVPSLSNMAARADDPVMRETMTMMDAVQQKIPGLRSKLPPARDLWGQPRAPQEVYGRAFEVLSPVKVTEKKESPIDGEMQRLNLDVRRVQKKMNWDGVDVNLRDWPEVYDDYARLAGNDLKHPAWDKGAKDYLDDVVSGRSDLSEVYNMKTDGEDGGKATFILNTISQFRQMARREIMADPKHEKFAEFINAKKSDTMTKRTGVQAPRLQ